MDSLQSSLDDTQNEEKLLAKQLQKVNPYDAPISAVLKTNQRVFARITDGIYREPASALRELIANAYDADATEVRIYTDAPRFSKIVIRDNGHGLDGDTLAHIICNIGGSLKRTSSGKSHNVTSTVDKFLSPALRPLIGKLGIGLFSVSQLTHHMVIVSKVKGDNKRLVCDILLRPQAEVVADVDEDTYVTGKAEITYVPAEDLESSGTEITLLNVRPFVRESLQSRILWAGVQYGRQIEAGEIEQSDEEIELDDELKDIPREPDFHIGEIDPGDVGKLITMAKLPWSANDSPLSKFRKLVSAVSGLTADAKRGNVKLKESLDSYLRMIWSISLSVPLDYIDKHPFAISAADNVDVYMVSNGGRGSVAEKVDFLGEETLSQVLGLRAGDKQSHLPFSVLIDDIELRRPISIGASRLDAERQLMFVGKASPALSSVPEAYRGGELSFEYYMLWSPKVVPLEHNGSLIRINGANGTLFDSSFMEYQVSEQTRLRQLTGEVFALKGLDSSLNIDRESFNISHPHYQYLKKWLHNALRQFMSKHKSLSKEGADQRSAQKYAEVLTAIDSISLSFDAVSRVKFLATNESASLLDGANTVYILKDNVLGVRKSASKVERSRYELHSRKLAAVASILESYGLLSSLSPTEVEKLVKAISDIFLLEAKK
ncbi:ATP-binding protein [Pseudomonas sp. S1(2024)]|uniref:ATP-binding protein n=1 Tax=Pseudomonas sp. S1(2024) TaxID=3390191 RepID=UPI00397D3E91